MNPRLPASSSQWHVAFDPYGLTQQADWLMQAEKTEDILQLTHAHSEGLIIDVGFYVQTFRSCVIKNTDWEQPVEVFESTSEVDTENWVYAAMERYAYGLQI